MHKTLGPGFLESIYRKALLKELRMSNLAVETEKEVPVFYEGEEVGRHKLDLLVENQVVLELKTVENFGKSHYRRTSSGFEVDLIAGEMDLALEFKSTIDVRSADLKGLRALMDEHAVGRAVLVSRDQGARRTEDGIEMMHWVGFLLPAVGERDSLSGRPPHFPWSPWADWGFPRRWPR